MAQSRYRSHGTEVDPAPVLPAGLTYEEAVACAKQLRADQGRDAMLAYLAAHK